jgi:drug/metabolite transporter (DMT)-like permease
MYMAETLNGERSQRWALIFGGLAVFFWSTVATAFKWALNTLTPIQLVAIASLTTVVILGVVVGVRYSMAQVMESWRSAPGKLAMLGIINPAVYYWVLFQAYDLLPAQQAQPLNYIWALVLSLLAVPFLGQKLHRSDILALCAGFIGVLIIATRGDIFGLSFDSPLGVGLALLSTLFWAFYWIINTRLSVPAEIGLLIGFLHGTPLVWAVMLWQDGLPARWDGIASAVYVGFFEMGVTFLLWLAAMKKAENTSQVSNLIFLSPFLSLQFIHFFLGEEIHPATYAGLCVIIGSVLFQQWAAKRATPKAVSV